LLLKGARKAKLLTSLAFILIGLVSCKSEISLDLADPTFRPLGISTISGADMTEGGSRLVSVSLSSAATSDLSLNWNVTGQSTATNFVADSGVISVSKGQTSVNVNIQSVDDSVYEGLQTFQLVVSNGSASKSTTFTVADNEAAPQVQFATASATVAENVGTHNINTTLDHAVAYPTTVEFALNGTAFSGDHGLSSNTFIIPAGTTSFNFAVPIINDFETEGAETLDFEIINATANTLNIPIDTANKDYTLTISANDSAPTTPTSFDLSNVGSAAGSTNDRTVDVSLSGGSAPDKVCISETQMTKPVSTLETCTGGSGSDNGWHTSIPATIDISGGDGTKTVYVWIADSDGVVSLTPITDTIELDESSPVVAITSPAAGSAVNVGNFNNFIVSGTCSDDITTVNYTATGGDGGSTVCTAGTYTFALDYTAAANGSVSVDITHIDEAGNSNTESRSFTKSVVMTDPLISIKDQTSNSSLYTNSTTVDLDIVNDGSVAKWCVSQTQSTVPGNTATCAGSSWVLTKPTNWTFTAGEGSRTLYVWVATAGDAINPNNGSDTITLDTIIPSTADTTATHTATIANYTAFTIQGNCSENGQAVKLSGDIVKNLACSGGNWTTTENLSSFLNGTINITVNHSDAAENAAVALPIVITKSVFSVDPTSLALADSTANANYARSTSIDTVTIVDDVTAVKWCLSETQSTRPLNTSICAGSSWVSSEPTTLTLSSGDGLKTVYLWTATAADVVSQNSSSTTITLDTGIPTVAVANPSVGDDVLYGTYKLFAVNGTCSDDTRVVTVSNGIDTQTPTCTAGAFSTNLDFTGHLGQSSVNVTFDHDDAAGNTAVQKVVSVDMNIDIGTPTLAIVDGAPANAGYALDQNVNITIGGDVNATKWCVSETQSTAPANTLAGGCGGGNWDVVEPTTFTLSAGDGVKTVYVWISDNDDNISNTAVSETIELVSTVPTVAITSPAAASTIDLNNHHSFVVSGTCSEVGRNVSLSNAASATVICNVGGVWTHTFDLSALANGAIVFDVDHSGIAGNSATQDSRSFTKNVTMGDPSLAIDDQTSGSTAISNSLTVDAVIGSDTDALKWCLSETQNTKPANTTICAGSNWVTTRPTSWTFSAGEGSRNLYLWTAGNGDFINMGVISTSITIDTIASTIAFTTAANSAVANTATIAGTCTEDGNINVSGDVVSKTVACAGGTWSDSFDFSGQSTGTVTVHIDQTDAAGNVSSQVSRDFNKASLIHSLAADTIYSYGVDISYAVTSTTNLKTYNWAIASGATAPANCSSGSDFGNTNLTQTLSGLNSATQYSLRVCFINTSDTEVESTTVTFTTLAAASSGTALVCSGGGDINTTCNVNDVQAFTNNSNIYVPGNLVIQSGGSLTTLLTESIVLDVDGNITVESGGSIAANLTLLETTTLDIQAGGKIDASALGYAGGGNGAQSGTGPSPGIGFAGSSADPGGAGHASPGADGRASGGTTIYGNKLAPVTFGSGGGAGDDQDGGHGGGSIKIIADTLIVNGDLLANGANGVSSSSDQGGGGAGGSLWINATNGFSGTGTISAKGGDAGYAGNAGGAGSGSGGRIAIYQTNNNYGFDGTLSVQGGRRSRWAGNGSLYVSLTSMDQICDTGTLATTCTVSKKKYFGDTTTITGAGNLTIDATGKIISTGVNSSLNLNLTGNLDIAVGGEIRTDEQKSIDTLTANTVTIRGTINGNITNTSITSFTLFPTGIIDASGLGHWGAKGEALTGNGPSGGLGHSASSADPGGGGHAGAGGAGRVAGGTTIYGSRTAPVDYGSGGGSGDAQDGGNGGGAIKISATNMTINGTIRSNGFDGQNGGSDHGAGGAGGSIWLEATDSLSGTGTVEAKGGGAPVYDNQVPGGGSGGRIAIYQTNNVYNFNGTIDVNPDAIGSRGAVGTFYLGLTSNDQLCDSGNFSSTCTVSVSKKIGGDINITTGNLLINATGSLIGVGSDSSFVFNSTGDLDVLTGGSFSMVAGTSVTNLVAANFNMAGTWNANIADSTIGDANISGTINVDGLGFLGGSSCQDGFGTSPGQGTCNDGGGGAHATNGGNGDGSTAGTPAYGSNTAPVTWGSGGGAGGSQIGGAGGGAVKLDVTNTLTLTGTISADGINGGVNSDISGGGAGGSIWLAANDITGTGASVTVTGGQSGHSNSGGDGSGGRISVEAVNYSAGIIYDYTSGVGDGSFYTNLTNYYIACSGGGTVLTTCNVNDQQQILAGMTVNIPGNLVIQSGGDLTTKRLEAVTINVTGNLTIESGGKITSNLNNLIASTLDVQAGGLIDVTGKGHLGGKVNGANGQGPSPGTGDNNDSGAGAGHAGIGAKAFWGTHRLGGQVIYGSKTNPVDYGSGGGAGDEQDAGDGGGILRITATDLIVNGDILAAGANGAYSGCCDHAGGGSGGSIWITAANSFNGTGNISVKGGNSYGSGGAGSGGRLAIYQTANTYNFNGTILTERGSNGSTAGEASFYLSLTSLDQLCDSGGFGTTCTISSKKTFGDVLNITTGNLTITGTGSLVGKGMDTALNITTTGNVEIQNGGSLELDNLHEVTVSNVNTFTVAGNLKANLKDVAVTTFDLQASGSIDVSSLGHPGGTSEDEAGQGLSPGGGDDNDAGGGAGHASLGGDDSFSGGENLGGSVTYGIATAPVEYGSGGGSGEFFDGGYGGGVVKIFATNLSLNGSILAKGGNAQLGGGCCDHGGGGSGGSIWISTSGSLSGTGTLNASGGNSGGQYGGSGSGGRIALAVTGGAYTFNGSITNVGGTGNVSGPGSIELNITDPSAVCTTGTAATTCTMNNPLYVKDINVTGDLVVDSSQNFLGNATVTVGGDFTLKNTRTITSADGNPLSFNVSGNTIIEAGAKINANISDFISNTMTLAGEIDVSELGHASYTGTGRGGLGSGGANPASGGGYGSAGGRGYENNAGVTYGTESAPTDYGSGGGYDNHVTTTGGAGGGAVKLTIADMLTLTGSIKSNGQTYTNYDAGAGSGGSIWINSGSITGAGTLEAKGGNASPGGYLNGAGGAGRIAIVMTDALGSYDYSGSVNMLNDFDSGIDEGSFYVSLADNDSICDSGDFSTTCTMSSNLTLGGTQNFTGANFDLQAGNTINIYGNNTTIDFDLTGSFSTAATSIINSSKDVNKIHAATGITIAGDINAGLPDIYSAGAINVTGNLDGSGKGFLGGSFHADGQGTGAGARVAGGLNPAAAGGHGGSGGDGSSGGSGGGTYGSATEPNTKGSGGASDEERNGGAGGGVIKIESPTSVAIGADIKVNGIDGETFGGGGGAGGSIYIKSASCSGSGNLEAKGGDGIVTFNGAGGGGGRIHVNCAASTWSGSNDVSGGTATGSGPSPGGAGTYDTTIIP
jgi:hypothetical protein